MVVVVVEDLVIAETVVVGFQEEEEVAVEDFPIEETTGFRAILVEEVVGKEGCACS